MPKVDYNTTIMRAQALEPGDSKRLLNFLLSSMFGDNNFKLAVHAGLKGIEKSIKSSEVKG